MRGCPGSETAPPSPTPKGSRTMKVSCPCGPQPPLAAPSPSTARRWHRWAGVALGLWLLLAGAAAAATGAPQPTAATVAASAPLGIQWEPIGPDTYHGQLVLYAADGAIQPLDRKSTRLNSVT